MMNMMGYSYWMGLKERPKHELKSMDRLSNRLSKREAMEYLDLIKRNKENVLKEKNTKVHIHKFRLFTRNYTILIEKRA